jgi:large subunit ribosomal protein L18
MLKQTDRNGARLRRHSRVRGKVRGTAERPRLAVFRSITHTYAQVIDDTAGRTLAAASTVKLKIAKNDLAAAQAVGKDIAAKAVKAGVSKVVFDRGGYIYHGRVKALAEAAREAGLEF